MKDQNFSRYARYYDLLYRDKDYAGEARFVDGLLRESGARAGTLFELGCGTGAHARQFAQLGWRVTAVDLSADMIGIARSRTPAGAPIEFVVGTGANCAVDRTKDAAMSLFHVASYHAAPGEALKMFTDVRRQLAPGARFVFDFWHGPGVQADPPVVRVRRVADEQIRVTRIAEPTHRPEESRVDVAYEVFVEDVASGRIERFTELHRLRYFSAPELTALLDQAGFTVEKTLAGLEPRELDARSWYGLIVARAK